MNVPRGDLAKRLLRAADRGIRATAARVFGTWADRLPEAFEALKPVVADPHPRVRLEAVRALAAAKDPAAIDVAMSVLDVPMDRFLDFALYLTANDLQSVWLSVYIRDRPLRLPAV